MSTYVYDKNNKLVTMTQSDLSLRPGDTLNVVLKNKDNFFTITSVTHRIKDNAYRCVIVCEEALDAAITT